MQLVYLPPDPPSLIFAESVLDRWLDSLASKLKRALTAVRNALPRRITQLQTAYGLGNIPGILAAVPLDQLDAGMRPIIENALLDTARGAGEKELASRLIPRFDIINPQVVNWAQTRTGQQITLIGEESRKAIQDIITRSVSEGIDARSAARLIREHIGLNTRQSAAVANYRAGLVAQGVNPGRIDSLVEKATKRHWRQRAEMIARTEIQSAANFGQLESWRQAAAQGLLDPSRTRRVWIASSDACPICLDLAAESRENPASLDGSFFGVVGSFESPPAHPSCRCAMGLEFI